MDSYVTVRIPKGFDELIKAYIQKNKKTLKLIGRVSRAHVVKIALYQFLKEEGIVK